MRESQEQWRLRKGYAVNQLAEAFVVLMFMVVMYSAIVFSSGARWIAWFLAALFITVLLAPNAYHSSKDIRDRGRRGGDRGAPHGAIDQGTPVGFAGFP